VKEKFTTASMLSEILPFHLVRRRPQGGRLWQIGFRKCENLIFTVSFILDTNYRK
jgi:hypothetical protein